jgi:hypothetical protein
MGSKEILKDLQTLHVQFESRESKVYNKSRVFHGKGPSQAQILRP